MELPTDPVNQMMVNRKKKEGHKMEGDKCPLPHTRQPHWVPSDQTNSGLAYALGPKKNEESGRKAGGKIRKKGKQRYK